MSHIPSALPAELAIGIVHLGLGAFHRAHQAVYTEDAIQQAGGDWGICAVAMRSRELATVMLENNGRYSLIEQQADGPELRELSVIREVLCLPDSPGMVIQRISDPAVHLVSVTVTEKGYCFSGPDRHLNTDDPLIMHDLANPSQARSMPGILVAGLRQRRESGGTGLSILSCDNLPANGKLLRQIVLSHAALLDAELAQWIEQNCRFPDSMVDRITPAATVATLTLASDLLGRADPAAIETEPFRQWVIEDDFAGPRPAWEKAGAQFVADVAPFEDMKLRMLNGAHSLIAYLGAVSGLPAVRDVMQVSAYRTLLDHHMAMAAETLEGMDKEDAAGYRAQLLERFENPAIDHRCLQIAMDGSQKMPQRILTPASIRLARGMTVDTYALATALWVRYLMGRDEQGAAIDCSDPLIGQLQLIFNASDAMSQRIAGLGRIPGVPQDLFNQAHWVDQVADLVNASNTHGVRAVVSELVDSI
ncbi:mannitol dehydrogenase family protein [Granulosicoccus sp. 3-233]|uniref:mannitol dehydrogenase family protein n=1 Tax=Granulosicoccus sp. 3-233 TaxID=3417969 RepID=UPI003D328C28